MNNVTCPYCKKQFPLSEGLSHELKEKLENEKQKEIAETKQKMNEEAINWREEKLKEIEKKAKEKIHLDFKNKQNEIEELRKQNNILQEQLLEINRSIRLLKTERDQEKIEYEKKLIEEQDKIRTVEKKRSDEENHLKILEKEKQLNDALKVNEELKRKLEQGSQQIQGEVLELELEELIKREFPYDEIKPVPKGVRGGDIIQIVKNNYGKLCGMIIWESKRTKAWSENWIAKLKEDQRQVKAEISVIITDVLPQGIKTFGLRDGVWISDYQSIIGLAMSLRHSLINLMMVRQASVGKQEKKEILWNYLNSTEFQQRVEAIYEAYSQMMEDLKKEKDWYLKKWAKQQKNIQKVADNILGMHGDLEGIVGKSLPEITGLEMLTEEKQENKNEEKNSLF